MCDYALTYGAAVRPRKNRQQTTMARHETMPEMMYQRQLQISTNRDNLSSTESFEAKELEKEREVETRKSDPENDDQDLEYDSSTDEDEELTGGDSSISEFSRSHDAFWTKSQKKPQTFNVEIDRSFSSSEKMKMECRGLL